jgi:hypothetical protein
MARLTRETSNTLLEVFTQCNAYLEQHNFGGWPRESKDSPVPPCL